MTVSKTPSANDDTIYTVETSHDAEHPRINPDRRLHDRRASRPQLLSYKKIRSLRKLDGNAPLILRSDCRRQDTRRNSSPKPFSLLETDKLRNKN
jgi:hypothetical protein